MPPPLSFRAPCRLATAPTGVSGAAGGLGGIRSAGGGPRYPLSQPQPQPVGATTVLFPRLEEPWPGCGGDPSLAAPADLLLVTFEVMPDAIWSITVQWLAGDMACRTLTFLKRVPRWCRRFWPGAVGLDRQAAVLNPLGPGAGGRKPPGAALGAPLAVPQLFLFHIIQRAGPVPFTQCVTKGSSRAQWQGTYNLFTCSLTLTLVLVLQPVKSLPPSLSHILFLSGLLNAPLDPLLYGVSSKDSSKEATGGRPDQALRQLEVQAHRTSATQGEAQETFL
ncbi:LOW QUALITY PROTEIN: gonadotropin-releasing hormone II receptor-like [Thomomys bottae]